MKNIPAGLYGLSLLLLSLLVATKVVAQETHTPELGSQVPQYVLKAKTGSQSCVTDTNHEDPCATVSIANKLFTIAWDSNTKEVVYIFTEDRHIITSSELGVGGSCRIRDDDHVVRYMNGLVTRKWVDQITELSGEAWWYAVLRPDTSHPGRAKITGFVQSRYIKGTDPDKH